VKKAVDKSLPDKASVDNYLQSRAGGQADI
jgi:hypothetical protein